MAHLVKRVTKDGTHRFDVRAVIDGREITRSFVRRQDAEAFVRESESLERRPGRAAQTEKSEEDQVRPPPPAPPAPWSIGGDPARPPAPPDSKETFARVHPDSAKA